MSKSSINQNDGLVIYIKEQHEYRIEEPTFQEGNCLIIKMKDMVIIAIYRPPSYKNIDKFLSSLNLVLNNVTNYNNIVVIGDMNIDIGTDKTNINSDKYMNLTAFHGLLPAHNFVTRDASGTCIDHVFIKTRYPSMTIVPQTQITDHKPVLVNFYLEQPKSQYTTTMIKKIDTEKLYSDIFGCDFGPVLSNSNPNKSLDYFLTRIRTAIQNNTKVLTLSRRKKIIKPWITPGLLRCIRHRDKLHEKARCFPQNEINCLIYKRYRNFCNRLLKQIKINYDKEQINMAKNDNKKLWKVLKDMTNVTKKSGYTKELLNLKDTPQSSVDSINSFFYKCR
ncbi:unnamed protein product [Euphydryas editha]|uniref:Endonuclease/exonuclease/phosphatase domain-containing protein n=1 Tax=Euphydryas editha TaxID=104508 RepID=A0AAU9TBE4_EUPED|nr:unnamed protein product [Euphydryas editha]